MTATASYMAAASAAMCAAGTPPPAATEPGTALLRRMGTTCIMDTTAVRLSVISPLRGANGEEVSGNGAHAKAVVAGLHSGSKISIAHVANGCGIGGVIVVK